jgi:hypothetical protein
MGVLISSEFQTAGAWGDTLADDLAGAILTLAGGVPKSAQAALMTLLPAPYEGNSFEVRSLIYWRVPVVDRIPATDLYIHSKYIGQYRSGDPVRGLDWSRARAFAVEGQYRVCGSFSGCSEAATIPGSVKKY